MPVYRVQTTKDSKPVTGYRFGQHGHIYTGAGAQKKALQQGQAMYAAGWKGPKK